MKRFLLILSLLVSAAVFGQTRDLQFLLGENSFGIGRIMVPGDWQLKAFTSAIGSVSRIGDGYNRTHTYDELGLVLFEPKNKETEEYVGRVSEIQVYFQPMEKNKTMPANVFTGTFMIDDLSLSAQTTIETIRAELKGFEGSMDYTSNFRVSRGPYYIFFHFKKDGTLTKVSAGLVKKK